MSPLEPLLVFLASVMAAATAVFLAWCAESRTGLRASIVVFLLLMMTGMIAGGLVYLLAPSASSAVEGLWVAAGVMAGAVVLVFVAFLRAAAVPAASEPPVARPVRGLVASAIGLVVLNEFLMGWALSLADGTLARSVPIGATAVGTWAASIVVSPWFVFTMAAEMLVTVALLRRQLGRSALLLFAGQGAVMALSPPAFPAGVSAGAALYLGSAAMIGLFVFVMELLYRQRSLAAGFAAYLVRMLAVYAVMMAGLVVWSLYGTPVGFAIAVVLEMLVFFDAVLRPARLAGERTFAWQERPSWTTALLGSVFLAELFMGAVLALALTPGTYLPGPRLALAGSAATVVAHAAANGFYFVTNTTASTWFLAMMGLEMGALVVFRMREVHGRERRVQLAVMLACFGAFAVFYPSIYYAAALPHAPGAQSSVVVPVLGWSMGLGSAPVAPLFFGTIAATYVTFTVVTFLFGRRAVCSTFCTAATMYQGTTFDAMKSFNRSSPTARRYLGSRWSKAYSWTAAGVLVAFAGSAVVSLLDQTGRLALSVGGTDPSVFFFDLSFGVLWYALFVTVPYVGEYNCVTLGVCYTGLLAGASSRVGFFRLKVRDREVCRRCTTFDCARSCPVGLTDMPAQFRARGEFRSSKCCGVGDCAEACPYGNLYLADVRHALAARWRPRPAIAPESRLPMAGPRPAPPEAAAAPAP
jgi:hypothetical protein